MTKSKSKSKMIKVLKEGRWDFKNGGCEYEYRTWCNLPKYKRCKHCIRCVDGSKACEVTAL